MSRARCFLVARLQHVVWCAVALMVVSTAPSGLAASPVRVGARTHVDHVELEVHQATGHLFAVVRFTIEAAPPELDDTYGVAVNLSTDGGSTWSETFSSSSVNRTEQISTTVASDFLYLATERAGAESGLLDVRRFSVLTGGSDASFGFHTVVDVGAGQLKQMVLFGNANGVDGALYLVFVDRGGSLRFLHTWDFLFDDGATADDWSEIVTGVTDADASLDAAFNAGDSAYSIFASYVDYSQQLCVWRLSQTANNARVLTSDFETNDSVRIAADRDLVMVVYSRDNGADRDIRAYFTYTAGLVWGWHDVAQSTVDGTSYTAPTIGGRWHRGMMVGFHRTGTGGDALATTRRPIEEFQWTPVELSSGIGLRTGTRTDIQPLAAGGWGTLFISDTGDPRAVYFMLTPLIFADGFGSGDSVLWD